MTKIGIGSAVLFALVTSIPAVAADLPVRTPPPVPAFSWTGCHVGVNGGWVGTRTKILTTPGRSYLNPLGTLPPPSVQGSGDEPSNIPRLTIEDTSTGSGWEAGIQYGCDWQPWTGVVIGYESDWQWSNVDTTIDRAFGAFPNAGQPAFTVPARTEHISHKLDWFSTYRLRGGFAFDRVFVYLTGGLAVARISSETAVLFATFPVNPVYNGARHFGSSRDFATGPVFGAGFEWAFGYNWSFKAEYLYMWFGEFTYDSPLIAAVQPSAPGAYAWRTTAESQFHVARVGLNYRFNLFGGN